MTKYTRRDAQHLTSDLLGKYHALVVNYDLAGFESLLAAYQPELSEETKRELVGEFTQTAEKILRRHWLSPK